jgi:hypothetical protein
MNLWRLTLAGCWVFVGPVLCGGAAYIPSMVDLAISVSPLALEASCTQGCVQPSILTVDSLPWSEVFVDGRRLGSTPLAQERLLPGVRKIRLANSKKGLYVTREVTIRAGTRVKIKATMASNSHKGTLDNLWLKQKSDDMRVDDCGLDLLTPAFLSVDTKPWSVVWVDGKQVGETPLYRHQMAPGLRHITLQANRSGRKLEFVIDTQEGNHHKIRRSFVPDDSLSIDPPDISWAYGAVNPNMSEPKDALSVMSGM